MAKESEAKRQELASGCAFLAAILMSNPNAPTLEVAVKDARTLMDLSLAEFGLPPTERSDVASSTSSESA